LRQAVMGQPLRSKYRLTGDGLCYDLGRKRPFQANNRTAALSRKAAARPPI